MAAYLYNPSRESEYEDSLGYKETWSQKVPGKRASRSSTHKNTCRQGPALTKTPAGRSQHPQKHLLGRQPTCDFSNREEETGLLEQASWLD